MERVHVRLKGCLQGVGFRPFAYNTAKRLGLFGYVRNDSSGVELELEGQKGSLEHFLVLLEEEKPRLAHIASRELQFLKPLGYADFQILPSTNHGPKEASVLPDIATCGECLKELADPNDIRFAHPFIACCHCGPRFTIVTGLPYDRPNTTMNAFEMCLACKAEYKNPLDRRFHAQPIACPSCGPTLSLFSKKGELLGQGKKALDKTLEVIKAGFTLALKGIGGYHLMADARNESAVRTLRERKGRANKPFAVMFPDLASIRRYALPSRLEEALILAPERPIVLVKSKPAILPDTIAPGLERIGVFLPYSPLHHLIFKALKVPLVATSGNFSEEPIVKDDDEALETLTRYTDLILMHDRPIARRCDDSVLKVVGGMPALVRRSRGYAPLPVRLPFRLKRKVLAAGGFLKNTVALGFEDQVILSQHIGDLSSFEAMEAYQGATKDLCALYDFKPALIVHDLHPAYPSSRWAKVQTKAPSVGIQHHFAHVLACMAENGLEDEALGVAWDGAGFGTDGTVWGGEFLACTYTGFNRLAHFRPLRLIGGELAQKEPRRMALCVLFELFGEEAFQLKLPPTESFSKQELRVLFEAWKLGINAPLTSSAGRLFDAFASLLGVCQVSSYEAEAAMKLETLVSKETVSPYPFTIEAGMIDTLPMFAEAIRETLRGVPTERIVSRFLATLADVCFRVSVDAGIPQVCLTGGVFLNDPLTTRVQEKLKDGFRVFRHNHTPPGDGGISLGQAVYGGMIDLEQPPNFP
jgi:hydrogenase maturation protein HypF